jgi:hypothetical protein
MITPLPRELEIALRKSPIVAPVFDGWSSLALPNCWLVAGAVFQTYWNKAHGFLPLQGISDIDLIYFDPDDLSDEAENENSIRINSQFRDLDVKFDVKNEARVHLWYEDRFGYPISAYTSAESAMETFPTTAGSIGVRVAGIELEAFAPFGFDDLLDLVIRPNKRRVTRSIYEDKVKRWAALWPRVRFLEWDNV